MQAAAALNTFYTAQEAISYCEKQGWDWEVRGAPGGHAACARGYICIVCAEECSAG